MEFLNYVLDLPDGKAADDSDSKLYDLFYKDME